MCSYYIPLSTTLFVFVLSQVPVTSIDVTFHSQLQFLSFYLYLYLSPVLVTSLDHIPLSTTLIAFVLVLSRVLVTRLDITFHSHLRSFYLYLYLLPVLVTSLDHIPLSTTIIALVLVLSPVLVTSLDITFHSQLRYSCVAGRRFEDGLTSRVVLCDFLAVWNDSAFTCECTLHHLHCRSTPCTTTPTC